MVLKWVCERYRHFKRLGSVDFPKPRLFIAHYLNKPLFFSVLFIVASIALFCSLQQFVVLCFIGKQF